MIHKPQPHGEPTGYERFASSVASSTKVRTPKPVAPLSPLGLAVIARVDARDVEMRPGRVVDEVADHLRRRDRAAARPPVCFISAISLRIRSSYSSSIGIGQSRSPAVSAAASTLCCKRLVVAEEARAHLAQRDDDRAGQRRRIHHRREAQLHRLGERVGQHQPPLGVGVEDLDGLAVRGAQDIAGTIRRAARAYSRSSARCPSR